jgi:8-oxo-dGTP diphosphatase
MPYTYDYPRPMVTVDIFLTRFNMDHLELVLIKRKNDPFKGQWALPGGYVEIDEPLKSSAKRELFEETGIENIPLYRLNVFGDPGRDPRGRTITIVYFGVIPYEVSDVLKAGDDAAESQWFGLDNLPEFAFDHDQIVETCHKRFQSNLLHKFWFLLFLENEFNAEQILELFENISELKFPIDKIHNILFNLPFISQTKRKHTFLKNISNNDILKLNDDVITNVWRNILSN